MNLMNIILKHSIGNAKDCVINTRELNRTSIMGEAKRHRSKYADNLKINHISLMSDIQLLLNIESSKQVKFLKSHNDKEILDKIIDNWQKVNMSIKPYQKITKELEALQKNLEK